MSERDFYLFAGINGAGKSTLFSTVSENIKNTFRINTDEVVKKSGDWRNEFDNVVIYDNTKKYRMILKIVNKKIIKKSQNLIKWAKNIIKKQLINY